MCSVIGCWVVAGRVRTGFVVDRRLLAEPGVAVLIGPLGFGDDGGGEGEARGDVVGHDLDRGAVFTVGTGPAAGEQPPDDHDLHPGPEGLGRVFRLRSPHRPAQERRGSLDPLAAVLVVAAWVVRQREARNRFPDGVRRSSGSLVRFPTP